MVDEGRYDERVEPFGINRRLPSERADRTVLGCGFRSQPQPDILRTIILILRGTDLQLVGAEFLPLLPYLAAHLLLSVSPPLFYHFPPPFSLPFPPFPPLSLSFLSLLFLFLFLFSLFPSFPLLFFFFFFPF